MAAFYVRADGSATKANAIGPTTDATKCMSLATFNAATYAAGDTVYFSDKGGAYTGATTGIIIPSAGASGNPILYAAATGETPTFNFGTVPLTVNGKSFVTVQGLTLANTLAGNAAVNFYGVTTGVTFQNLAVSATQIGFAIFGTDTNAVIQDIVFSGAISAYLVKAYVATHTNLTIRRITSQGAGMQLQGLSTGLIEDVTGVTAASAVDTGTTGVTFRRWTCSGIVRAFTLTQTSSLVFEDCTFTTQAILTQTTASHDIIIRRCTVTNANTDGFKFTAADYNITYQDTVVTGCVGDGFITTGGCHDFLYERCWAHGNGDKATTSDGDGFTCHTTDYNINIRYCLATGNTCSGFAMVGTSSGTIYNCVAYGNGVVVGGAEQVRGGYYFGVTANNATSGTSWTVKNCIGQANYPCEVAMGVEATAIVAMDYNCYQETTAAKFATLAHAGAPNQPYVTWATYHATYEAHSLHADPGFTNAAGNRYQLRHKSCAYHAGVNVSLTTDYAGRPVPNRPSMGAYEGIAGRSARPSTRRAMRRSR